MAPRVSRVLGLCLLGLCLLLLRSVPGEATGEFEVLLTSDSAVATTGAEVNLTASLRFRENNSLFLPPSSQAYRFHWVYGPLLLMGKSDGKFSSSVRVVGSVPGDFAIIVWVTTDHCRFCHPVATDDLVLSITESIVGKVVIGLNSSLPWPSTYDTQTVLKSSFVLHDPSHFFKNASLLYSWEFEDGSQMVTPNSTVYYKRSIMGSFTVKVTVLAEWEEAEGKGIMQKTGDFTGTMKLQETLRGIQVVGPTHVQAFEQMKITLNFLGSPPLSMCWHIRTECRPLEDRYCRRVTVTTAVYNMTTIIMDPGEYCFSIRAENVISKTQQYYKVQVWPTGNQPAVLAFPCATIITMMLAFIMYVTLRNTGQQPKDMVEVADSDFPPMSDKNPEPPSEAKCCQMCCVPFLLETPSEYLEVVRENHGLLSPPSKPVKTYTV